VKVRIDDWASDKNPFLSERPPSDTACPALTAIIEVKAADQLLSRLINDLAASAYGDILSGPKVVRDDLIKAVGLAAELRTCANGHRWPRGQEGMPRTY
jgi:hypothetical protein